MTDRDEQNFDVKAVANDAAVATSEGRQIAPFSSRMAPIGLAEAYRVTAELRRIRGDRLVGRKIGFTNRSIWPRYGVTAPIWGDVTDKTLHQMSELPDGLALAGLCEPRIEPEIVFGLAAAPTPDMDDRALAACIDWVAPGFEIVQSIYPNWEFKTQDTIIAGGLHGYLLVGEHAPTTAVNPFDLPEITMRLLRNGVEVETGKGSNVLDGPLSALRHIVSLLADDPHNPPLSAGEVVTTGTMTDAWPIVPGETWRAEFAGAPLNPVTIGFI